MPVTEPSRWARAVVAAALAAATLPIVVAMVRGLARGWVPVGDNAYFVIRARDVLTEHHPLLGTWTSASLPAGVHMNNPGPLLFDLYALPARFGVGGAGIAVGAAAVNVAAAVGIVLFARRRAGSVGAAAAALAVTGLTWSMGSEHLYEPWQPHSLLLPFLLFLVLVWSLLDGDLVALPWAVGVGSLLVQTHFSYALLVGVLGLTGAIGWLVPVLRARRAEGWVDLRRRAGRVAAVAGVVAVLCWAQPLAEQIVNGSKANLARLAQGVGDAPAQVGAVDGARMTASVVALPPWWGRPSFADAFLPAETTSRVDPELMVLAGTPAALGALAGVGVLLLALGWAARRRHDRPGGAAVGTVAVALLAGLVTAGSMPIGTLGVAPHQFRWLWPIAVFLTATVLLGAARLVPSVRTRPAFAGGVLVAVAVVLALANLPTAPARSGPAADAWAIPVVRDLVDAMEALEGAVDGPLVLDFRNLRFAEPYSGPVMAELQRRSIPFVVRPGDEVMERQLGSGRRPDASATTALRIREGDAARRAHAGERRAVFRPGPTPKETVGLFLGPLEPPAPAG